MGRFVVVVLDSFGIGYMDDVHRVRPQDIGANTCKHILEKKPNLRLKTLEKLGLINALGEKVNIMDKVEGANYGRADLMHFGGDTFFGHQEIMGTFPKMPLVEPFSSKIDDIYKELVEEGYKVEYEGDELRYLIVEDKVTIGDNLEADLGQVYNLTATLSYIPYEKVLEIGRIVRRVAKVARVIVFGGEDVTIEDLKDAKEEKEGKYIGINAPKSGVYNKGYMVRHLGYGIDEETQIQTILGREGIESVFIGKVADIVENKYGKSYKGIVDTSEVFEIALKEIKERKNSYFCINVQETDLAGHSEDLEKYAKKLEISDSYLEKIIELLGDEDILIVTADHGNDPTIGHSKHTRERVPLLLYKKGVENFHIGDRKTLSDIGASVGKYYNVKLPENGSSFIDNLKK